MDDDTDLIARLSARAGMIMEDASLIAVTMGVQDKASQESALAQLVSANRAIAALIDAAVALDRLGSSQAEADPAPMA